MTISTRATIATHRVEIWSRRRGDWCWRLDDWSDAAFGFPTSEAAYLAAQERFGGDVRVVRHSTVEQQEQRS